MLLCGYDSKGNGSKTVTIELERKYEIKRVVIQYFLSTVSGAGEARVGFSVSANTNQYVKGSDGNLIFVVGHGASAANDFKSKTFVYDPVGMVAKKMYFHIYASANVSLAINYTLIF